MSRPFYRHKKGGLYFVRVQGYTDVPLVEGERVTVSISDGLSIANVLVAGGVGEFGLRMAYIVYTDAYDMTRTYLRSNEEFYDGRFVLEPGEPGAPAPPFVPDYGAESDAVMARAMRLAESGRRGTYFLTPREMYLLDIRWHDPRLIREHTPPVLGDVVTGIRVTITRTHEAQLRRIRSVTRGEG